jgi:hypothetical protein
MSRMSQEDIIELHALITDWAYNKKYDTPTLLSFLYVTFIGTLDMKGYSQDFVDRTSEKMKEDFKKRRSKNER